MTQTEAHGALLRFVQAAAARGDVCLRIITGKGLRGQLGAEPETRPFVMDERRPGVLRERVPQWLAEPPLRGLVRGLESAGPRQGGSGALYVLLKRRR
jgi:DNA-nicking Smr family endonuclease